VEDRIRATKDTGLRNPPFHHADQNRVWLEISALAQDLLAWCAALPCPPSRQLRAETTATATAHLAVADRLV
jgi:hypothetical protein